ncbi:FG-GAP repeat domain-containing protein [Roseobacter weihaiensis]|uniref:FG-GAP repeat domain-containing protein n=1 Tax=Roseobacter weihaiensis TaxID=2763262 RepID=UPI0022223B79|nr:VCBS repeat-containing protein [Roseobacter sp. H9]
MILKGARRLPARSWLATARRALLALCLWHGTAAAEAEGPIIAADYAGSTDRYPHAVLGDAFEYGALVLTFSNGERRRFVLPESSVFEDTAPRLADLEGDGHPEVIVVESDRTRGARLAIYGAQGILAATSDIGTRFRWLAPLGAADLDGDGRVEIAYIDRPHLDKTLRVWRFSGGTLEPLADLPGVTNHRIGERDIAGGMRACGARPEMIVASADWSALLAVTFGSEGFSTRRIGNDTSRAAFARAMRCQD